MDCSQPDSIHGFFQEGISGGLPLFTPGSLPNPGIEPASPSWQADCLPLPPYTNGKASLVAHLVKNLPAMQET